MLSCHFTVLPAEHKHVNLSWEKIKWDTTGDWIQFQSNKIAEISLFMEMKYALSNDRPAMETIKRSYPDATDAYSIYMSSTTDGSRYIAVAVCHICHTDMLSLKAARVNLYCQCYHWGPAYF